jgi:hypothetical protein
MLQVEAAQQFDFVVPLGKSFVMTIVPSYWFAN